MDFLDALEAYIKEFNERTGERFAVDTVRIEFNKRYKMEALRSVGNWYRINANDRRVLSKLQKRLTADELMSAYKLEGENIYYYNSRRKDRKVAVMVIFGMKQYHKAPPTRWKIESICKTLTRGTSGNAVNVDVCADMQEEPNIKALKERFDVMQYTNDKGELADTYYINDPFITMIEKITVYNKAIKNALSGVLWRVEALIEVPNRRSLALPLFELRGVLELLRGGNRA